MTPENVERYARHLVLKEIGGPGQQALMAARIAIVGAGGLGGPAGLYLAAAGIGHITLIDDDVVALSNLQRQIQFTQADIKTSKVTAMSKALQDINSELSVSVIAEKLTHKNAADILGDHDVILDGVDNFQTRFDINAASLTHKIALVSGALGRWDGQLAAFSGGKGGPCYRCWVPEIPPQAETCAQVGVVGALAGLIGSAMALETIKIITGAGQNIFGSIWIYNGLAGEARKVKLPRDPNCPHCSSE